MAQEAAVRIEGLTVSYRRRRKLLRVLNDVSFDIGHGEAYGLVGESGCGKTTTIMEILGLQPPQQGRISVLGRDVGSLDGKTRMETRRDLQVVFQDPMASLDPRLPISDIVAEPLRAQGFGRAETDARVRELMELVGLNSKLHLARFPSEFSGGQRQRIGIARALALGPDLVFADEPVSALDVSVQAQILVLLDELRHRRELAFVFISHDLGVVRHFCQRVAVMYLGRIVEEGPVPAIFEEPLHPYTRLLKSSSPIPDPAQAVALDLQEGEPPSPVDPPSGCHFHPRCPFVMERCKVTAPELKEVAPGRRVACYLFSDASGNGAGAVAARQ